MLSAQELGINVAASERNIAYVRRALLIRHSTPLLPAHLTNYGGLILDVENPNRFFAAGSRSAADLMNESGVTRLAIARAGNSFYDPLLAVPVNNQDEMLDTGLEDALSLKIMGRRRDGPFHSAAAMYSPQIAFNEQQGLAQLVDPRYL